MARRRFNWKFAIVFILVTVGLAVAVVKLGKMQRDRRSEDAKITGLQAFEEGRWEQAAADLGRYIARDKNKGDVEIILKYAQAHLNIRPLKMNNINQAINSYRNILRLDSSNMEASANLISIYKEMNAPGEAEGIALRALELNQNLPIQVLLAMVLTQQRKFKDAQTQLLDIIENHPEHIAAYEELGRLIEQQPEEFPEASAEHWFNEAVKNNPASALAYLTRANFYWRRMLRTNNRGDLPRAQADLQQAELMEPSEFGVLLSLAELLRRVGELEKSEEYLNRLRQMEPSNGNLWQIWASLAQARNDKNKMVQIAEGGLKEMGSLRWDFMPQAIELFIQAGALDKAAGLISEMQQQDVASGTLKARLETYQGNIAYQRARFYPAIEHWRQAIQLAEQAENYNTTSLRLNLANTLFEVGDHQMALRDIRTLVSQQPQNAQAASTYGNMLYQTGNYLEAAKYAQIAAQLLPGNLNYVIFSIEAQMQILDVDEDIKQIQALEKLLNKLNEDTDGSLEVKLLQFQLAFKQNKIDLAEQLLGNIKQDHASNLKVVLAEYSILSAQSKTDQAITHLQTTIESFPDEVVPVRLLSILFMQQGRKEEGAAVIHRAIERIPNPKIQSGLGLLLAELFLSVGDSDQSYRFLNDLTERFPQNIAVKRRLLQCAQVINDPLKAQKLVNEIKQIEGPEGWQWRYEQAQWWFRTEDFDTHYTEAVSRLEENLRANSFDQASRLLLGALYQRSGEMQLAASTFRVAYNLTPQDLPVIVSLVTALNQIREFAEATDILNRAAREKISHPALSEQQTVTYLGQGKLDDGINSLENLMKNDPENRATRLLLASLKIQQKDYAGAEILLDELSAADPNDLSIMLGQIDLNINRGASEKALALCDHIVNTQNNSQAFMIRARTYALLGQPLAARKDYDRALALAPDDANVLVNISGFLRSQGQIEEAVAALQKALAQKPDNLPIQKSAITLFQLSGDANIVTQGRTLLEKALKAHRDDVDLRFYQANLLLTVPTRPAIEQAVNILREITVQRPDFVEPWRLLGEISLRDNQPQSALDWAARGLDALPDHETLLWLKARAERMFSPARAIPTLEKLEKLNPENAVYTLELADIYAASENSARAVELLNRKMSTFKDQAVRRGLNVALAAAKYKSGLKEEALMQLDALFEADPNDLYVPLTQARLLKEDQQWSVIKQKFALWYEACPRGADLLANVGGDLFVPDDDDAVKTAQEILNWVLKKQPDHIPTMQNLAMILQAAGYVSETAALYQKILALNPNELIALNNLAWILCENRQEYQNALKLAQRGLQINPDYLDLVDTRGVIYYRLGEWEKAAQDFAQCVQLYPQGKPALTGSYFHLGRAQCQMKNKSEAQKNLKQALDLHNQRGGLSPEDAQEAQRLLEIISKGV